jgi:hypothetical protein
VKSEDPIEAIEHVSQHPIYGIAEDYGHIHTNGHWYEYDPVNDRLLRSTKSDLFEELPHAPE